MKGEINNNTIIGGDFNTPLTTMDRSSKQKINKETQTLNDIMGQLDLIDIYMTFHPKTIKKMEIGTFISVITLNANGLNALSKRHRLAEWIQKQDPHICCLQEKPTSDLKTHID